MDGFFLVFSREKSDFMAFLIAAFCPLGVDFVKVYFSLSATFTLSFLSQFIYYFLFHALCFEVW